MPRAPFSETVLDKPGKLGLYLVQGSMLRLHIGHSPIILNKKDSLELAKAILKVFKKEE